jgi:hypothetical protein
MAASVTRMIGHIVFAGSAEPLDDDQYIGRFAGLVEQALPAEAAADEVRYTTHALIGMTSWIYKWFDPARDDRDEIARRMIRLVVSGDVDVEAALASASQDGRPAPDPAAPPA